MFRNKKLLVKGFDKILERGDLKELKQVFNKCDVNATNGKYGSTVFGMKPLNKELLQWLIEQGGDINKPDYYGIPPIFKQVSKDNDNLYIMVELGADIFSNTRDERTLMRCVLDNGTTHQIEFLIKQGLSINATKGQQSALEYLLFDTPENFQDLLEKVEFLLSKGAVVTDKSLKLLSNLKNTLEYRKDRYDSTTYQENISIIDKLFDLLQS